MNMLYILPAVDSMIKIEFVCKFQYIFSIFPTFHIHYFFSIHGISVVEYIYVGTYNYFAIICLTIKITNNLGIEKIITD